MAPSFLQVVLIALFLRNASFANGQLCTNGDVRLVGGNSNLEGRVEVCSDGSWGTVCDDGWEDVDADVVCSQLGHSHEDATARNGAYYGQGSGRIVLDDVSCSGYEDRLIDCPHRGIGVHDCSHYEDAGVVCVPLPNVTFVQNNLTGVQTEIEALRLVNGDTDYMGRLELLYNGTWGTVCDNFWSYTDAKVACRMLGFDDAVCAVTSNYFGRATSSVPSWIDHIQCLGSEEALDQCNFTGLANYSCSYSIQDVGVVCKSENAVGIPYNITLVRSTTKSLTLSWNIPKYPNATQSLLFFISYMTEAWLNPLSTTVYPSYGAQEGTLITYTIRSLTRNTEYDIKIRIQVQCSACSTTYTSGVFSDLMTFRTNDTLRSSNISIRLISPYYGVDFLGRVEVFHNGQWGTICDRYFHTADANVICGMAGFSEAICTVYNARFGRGYNSTLFEPIWLYNIGCSTGDEVLEDCSRLNWGRYSSSYCSRYHSDDVGVICRPNNMSRVDHLTVRSKSTSHITLTWEPYTFPRGTSYSQIEIWYSYIPGSWRYITISGSLSQYSLNNILFNQHYNISIRPKIGYSYCYYTYIYGPFSPQVSATTVESAPDGPPSLFNIEAINETAIEALWGLPAPDLRNGIIRGYKLFVQARRQNEMVINVTDNSTQAYIIGRLQPRTAYTVSILAYTAGGNGPRSIHLTVVTRTRNRPLIIGFGVNGNNLDTATRSYLSSSIIVHCTTRDTSSTTVEWFFANGTRVGPVYGGSNIAVYSYNNGTTVLDLGIARGLTYCEGGRYTCVVNTTAGHSERRIFHLSVGSSLPQPSRPTYSRRGGNFVTLVWSGSFCDGGHEISSFRIRYGYRYRRYYSYYSYYSYYTYSYSYITVSNPTQRSYKVSGLSYTTTYYFSIRATSTDGRTSSYSSETTITTLSTPPSTPRNVVIYLVRPLLVQVRWSRPSVTNGAITQYKVYATPLEIPLQRRKRQISDDAIVKVFSGSAISGNVTLSRHSVFYQFQVSAATGYGLSLNEGSPSPVTASTTMFVPEPGLPKPVNVHVSNATNASLTVSWNYPPPPIGTVIRHFLVTYSGNVEWRSPAGNLIQFEDSGEAAVNYTSIVLSPLIPGTNYLIKVSIISLRGRGEDVLVSGDVNFLQESLAYFQLRFYPVANCHNYLDLNENITEKLMNVRSAIVNELVCMCPGCHLTRSNIRDDEFSCRGGLTDHIVYRAMVIGTTVYSPGDLLFLIQSWVRSGNASVLVPSTRLYIDQGCDALLDTLGDPDCPPPTSIPTTSSTTTIVEPDTTAPSMTTEYSGVGNADAAVEPVVIKAGTIGGAILAIIITLLVIVLLIVLIVIIIKWKTSLYDKDDDDPLLDCSATPSRENQSLDFEFSDTDSKEESEL